MSGGGVGCLFVSLQSSAFLFRTVTRGLCVRVCIFEHTGPFRDLFSYGVNQHLLARGVILLLN